ncbi:MAG: formylglycine-generating enzyme family protein [Planctomycetota bacterium]|nr:formylglycine-generating enzyme family protein [Planctomycetota bacterium]
MKNPLLLTLSLFAVAALSSPAFSQATLSVDPVYEGGTATMHITGGSSKSAMIMCYSFTGAGPTSSPNGLVVDLSIPIKQMQPIQLDRTGAGQLGPRAIPDTMLVGDSVWVQGVEVVLAGSVWGIPTNMVPVTVEKEPGPDMVFVSGGTFDMGDHHNVGWPQEQPVHSVTLDSFYMDQYEVTNQKFADYLNSAYAQGTVTVSGSSVYQVGGSANEICYLSNGLTWNGSSFQIDSGKTNHPAVYMTWYGACHYANWRSSEDNFTPCYDETTWDCDFQADGYRLPTEAEWEYAARGGAHNPYYQYPWNRNDINSGDAQYGGGGTVDVGNYAPNGYGLYDTSGNVWEWCNDWYDGNYYSYSPSSNPTGPSSSSHRVIRGGGCTNSAISLRSAYRFNYYPSDRARSLGLRLLAVSF